MAHLSTPTRTTPPQRLLPRPPFWMVSIILIAIVASWIPLALIVRARYSTSTQPRIHIFQDMDNQPRFRPQQVNPLFEDQRAERPVIAGTVARGQLALDDHYYRGYRLEAAEQGGVRAVFLDGFPSYGNFQVTPAVLARGQQRFNIYCSVCHGLDGMGNGPINVRVQELQDPNNGNWVTPTNLHGEAIRARPDGHIYNTITNGIRSMGGYGNQISVEDRWAVVAYVRALQLSQHPPQLALDMLREPEALAAGQSSEAPSR